MSAGKVVLGTLAGLAIGAVAGMLFAPEKGSVTRKKILDKGGDYVDQVKTKFDDVVSTITEKIESTEKDAGNLMEKGKAKFDEARKDGKPAAASFSQ